MNTNLVNEITARQLKKDVPAFSSGDTVKVSGFFYKVMPLLFDF